MPRARPNKVAYYAVAVGRKTGVYTTWDDAKRQVDAFGGAKHKARPRAPRRALASHARRAIGD
jgi:viroplasmin and RNaseH domain-containing protein